MSGSLERLAAQAEAAPLFRTHGGIVLSSEGHAMMSRIREKLVPHSKGVKLILRAVLAAIMAAVAFLGVSVATAPSAAAVGCYGDYCSGQDPEATGCAAGAQTVASIQLNELRTALGGGQYWLHVGNLELRWSPTCRTNWARAIMHEPSGMTSIQVVQDTGYQQSLATQGWLPDTHPGTYWTPMIYSPVRACQGRMHGGNFQARNTVWV